MNGLTSVRFKHPDGSVTVERVFVELPPIWRRFANQPPEDFFQGSHGPRKIEDWYRHHEFPVAVSRDVFVIRAHGPVSVYYSRELF